MTTNFGTVNIEGLRKGFNPDEQVKLVLQRHWIVFVYTGFYALFLVVSTIVILIYRESVFGLLPNTFFNIFLILYWLCYLLFLYIRWINDILDLFVVTNNRIRGIEQLSFLNRTISECSLDEIEEVNAQTKGLLANIFNFGTITMHTASEKSDFTIDYAPKPLDNAGLLLNVIHENKTKNTEEIKK